MVLGTKSFVTNGALVVRCYTWLGGINQADEIFGVETLESRENVKLLMVAVTQIPLYYIFL